MFTSFIFIPSPHFLNNPTPQIRIRKIRRGMKRKKRSFFLEIPIFGFSISILLIGIWKKSTSIWKKIYFFISFSLFLEKIFSRSGKLSTFHFLSKIFQISFQIIPKKNSLEFHFWKKFQN